MFLGMSQAKKKAISSYLSQIGKKGGEAGKGAAKARSSEQAKKANAASHEAKRKKKAAEGQRQDPSAD